MAAELTAIDIEGVKDKLRFVLNNAERVSADDWDSEKWTVKQVGRLCGTTELFLRWRQYRVLEWTLLEPRLVQREIGARLCIGERTVRYELLDALHKIARRAHVVDMHRVPYGTPRDERESVYVIGSETGLYKIGRSVDVEMRFLALQHASPVPLSIVYSVIVDNAAETELKYHQRFASKRMRGEWFALDAADVATIIQETSIPRPEYADTR